MRTLYAISRLICLAALTLAFIPRANSQDEENDDSPPSIVDQPQMVSADERVPLELTCRASGQPEPVYTWNKNGEAFEIESNPRASLNGGNLVISSPQPDDNGEYQCFANNRLGTAISDKANATIAYLEKFRDSMPESITVNQGQAKVLRCGIQHGPPRGYPAPVIYWTDASAKPAPIEYDARVNQDEEGNLVFSNVNASDAGGYYCQAINNVVGASQRSPKITLNVNTNSPPTRSSAVLQSKPAANVIAIRTEELKLKCIASGYPTPSITWLKENSQLLSEGRMTIDEFGQELTISDVQFEDAGEYQCIASNSVGDDRSTAFITVEAAPYFAAPPSDETKGPGEEVTIECRASGVPAPTVDLLVNGQSYADFEASYDTGTRWTVVTGQERVASVGITGLVTSDSNVFQCLASNKYKEKLTSVVLNVISIPATINEFTPENRYLTVLQDSSATLVCHVVGRPTPQIAWTFKGAELTDGEKHSINTDEGRLVINDVMESDSGDYMCVATNNIDGQIYTAEDQAEVEVLAKTEITRGPEDVQKREGLTATFQCEISNDPQLVPVVYWMKGTQRLPNVEDDNSLVISGVAISDSGTYMCVVETTVEGVVHVVNSSATLSVQGRPSPPANVEAVALESGLRYVLSWDASNDNNAPISEYIVQYDTIYPEFHWVELTRQDVSAGDNIQRFSKRIELDPFIAYTFRVIAVNSIGESLPSGEYELNERTPASTPKRNPENVQGTSDDPSTVVIRWDAVLPYYYSGENFEYFVSHKREGASDWTDKIVPANTHYLLINASKPYQAFEIKVQSKNNQGFGPDPTPVIGHSGEASPSGAPGAVNVDVISANEVNVTWEPISEEDANGELLGYYVYYNIRIASGRNKERCANTPCIVGNLEAATDYEIYVVAFNGAGEGTPSEIVFVTTGTAPPGEVDLKVRAFSYRLVLGWKEPIQTNGELLGYNISIANMSDDSSKEGKPVFFIRSVNEPLTMRYKARPETKYRVEIAAFNSEGNGEWTVRELPTQKMGRPAKPPKPVLTGIGKDNANVTWDLANLDPTPSLVEVQYKKEGESEYKSVEEVDVLDKEVIMVSDLEQTTTYQVRLRVTNAEGATVSEPTGFKTTGTGEQTDPGFVMGTWMIILICIIILLILVLLIICIIKSQKGGKYNVSDKEKQLNKDIESTPLKDDGAFDEYKPPTGADGEPLRGSQGSLNNSDHGSSETDSLKEYADGETGKFDEEGSFIGQYGDNKKQRQPDEGEQGGAAYSTFV